jgi:DNA modification methylase
VINTCYVGDVRYGLRAFIAAGHRAQTCVTSPPYWGLRDYGVAGQIGLEPTPAEYIANEVEVFRLVRDALADDGTLWLNMGDSYSGSGKGGNPDEGKQATNRGSQTVGVLYGKTGESARQAAVTNVTRDIAGLAPKNLVGMPWRVALALQADGWYLRSDIIWAKPNPMPESVTDRPTKSHEYLFLLAKSERYFYDAAAIAEQASYPAGPGNVRPLEAPPGFGDGLDGSIYGRLHEIGPRETRNRRTVWTIATEPFSEAHFATFPTALVEPCVLAGSRVADIVLDPFLGSGTTAMVAQSLGRHWFGCELNPAYVAMQRKRTAQLGMELVA